MAGLDGICLQAYLGCRRAHVHLMRRILPHDQVRLHARITHRPRHRHCLRACMLAQRAVLSILNLAARIEQRAPLRTHL